jgi:hypothetical protein
MNDKTGTDTKIGYSTKIPTCSDIQAILLYEAMKSSRRESSLDIGESWTSETYEGTEYRASDADILVALYKYVVH